MSVPTPLIRELFKNNFMKYKDKIAVANYSDEITYFELWEEAAKIKNNILSVPSNNQPVRVGLLMENSIKYVICELSIIQAGATRIGLNTLLSKQEIEYIIKDAEIDILFINKQYLEMVLSISRNIEHLKEIVIVDEEDYYNDRVISWDRYLQSKKTVSEGVLNSKPTDIAMIAYTGGTTGKSKGVVLTQEILFLCLTSHIIETELTENDHVLLMTPFAHSAGMLLLTSLLVGAKVTIDRFNVKSFVYHIERGITFTFMVPTMIYRVLDYLQKKEYQEMFNLESLKTILYGAAPITKGRLEEGIKIFGNVFMQLYGQTESYNFITKLTKEDHLKQDGALLRSCGQPVYMSQVKIINEKGKELPEEEVGEVIVKSPYNMAYYLNKPKETKNVLKNGWLHTGDIGYLNKDGYLFLLDRKNDMIISGGFNVYSSEVEDILQKHTKVSQVAVLGLKDPDWGEKVVAVVIPKEGMSLTEQELKIFAKENLSAYKQPKEYYFLTALPVTPYGKVNKKLLRKQLTKNNEHS